ncbi:hypothetical protein PIB30_017788 [Stylosanthes scabra]|uniref:Uncharacterized protein n=1 Tax=Stylosanthes scabra TaxID=79078 RepID=A0ABU6U7N1_9FABA|nr:hypothetical protein [Stylosanthes scabra]
MSAVFAFGDSTIDPGNNNDFQTLFRGNHVPYGCDFPNHIPTGRFSNGKISTDYIVDMLGIKSLLPAYLDHEMNDGDLTTGVSFGTGGSGLDTVTAMSAKVMNMDVQFQYFQECLERIRRSVGDAKTNDIVKNSLFVISSGTNDMLFNAYLSPMRMMQFGSVSLYHDFLLQNLVVFIQKLYQVGARKIVVVGLPPIGCLPVQVTINSVLPNPYWLQRMCKAERNMECQKYNAKLQFHIDSLQTKLSETKLAYFDIYSPMWDMISNPNKYGFEQTLKGCCGTGLIEMGPICNLLDPTCVDPSKYLFWDAVHLTEIGYKFLAESGIQNLLSYFTQNN